MSNLLLKIFTFSKTTLFKKHFYVCLSFSFEWVFPKPAIKHLIAFKTALFKRHFIANLATYDRHALSITK